jgi:similar to stage IV sporulation protein
MLLWIISFLRGYLIIEARGFFIERFINLCIRQKVYLWDITKDGSSCAHIKISIKGFKRIRHAAFKSKTRVRIIKRCGLPLILNRYRRRKAFFLGAFIFIAVIITLTSFVWAIEITGLEKIEEKELRNQLGTCGVGIGVVKYGHSPSDIKNKMLMINPDLSWIWVDIRGTKAYVDVKERYEKPQIVPEDEPCNIVALRDGVIHDYIVRTGQPVVKIGDVVQKGQLLISGAVDSSVLGARLFHSDAEVYAATWYEKTGSFPLYEDEVSKTGKVHKRHTVKLGEFSVRFFKNGEIPYKTYEKEVFEKQLKLWGDVYLPVTYSCAAYSETAVTKLKLTEDKAKNKYGEELYKKITEELGNTARITNHTITHTINEQGMIVVTCSVECVEDIGTKIPIVKEEGFGSKDF